MSRRVLGILRINDSDIALDATHLVEVVRLESPLAPRPLAPHWSLGTLRLRGQPIPAIDLGRLLGLDASHGPREAGDFVAIIDYRGGRIGMRVSHVSDVISAEPEQLHDLKTADGGVDALTPQLLEHSSLDRPVYVLDIETLFTLEGMVAVHAKAAERGLDPSDETANLIDDTKRRWLVVESDGARLAFDANVVREVATCGAIEDPVIDLPGYIGNVALRGAALPLFDPKALIDQPKRRTPPSHLAVFDSRQGRVALAVDRIAALATLGKTDWVSITPSAGYSSAVSGLISTAAGESEALAIDHTTLFSAINVSAMARLHARLNGDVTEDRGQQDWKRFAFVHFGCGGDYVTLLDQLEAVDAMPAQYQQSHHSEGLFLGAWHRQGRSVSLVDLRLLLGQRISSPATHVLIADGGNGLVGFLIDGIRNIDYVEAPAASFTIRWRGDSRNLASPVDAAKRLIAVGERERRQVMALLCLQTLARHLTTTSPAERLSKT